MRYWWFCKFGQNEVKRSKVNANYGQKAEVLFLVRTFLTHLDKFEELLQVVAEDGLLQRRLECVRRRVDRFRNATVVLEDTARHSSECRRRLPRRPVPAITHLVAVMLCSYEGELVSGGPKLRSCPQACATCTRNTAA